MSGVHSHGNMEERKSGLIKGVVLCQRFIYRAIWRERVKKKWSDKRGGPLSGVHLQGNMEGRGSEEVVSKEGWSLIKVVCHLRSTAQYHYLLR